ncbi:MAG: hypothetical protein ACYCV0_17530, partial [Desulfitobacteriaceae bacterium]
MFMSKATLGKIALGSMLTSVMTFATLMPASAHELEAKADSNANMVMQGGVQEGLLPLSNLGLPDKAAAQIISLGDGVKEILVMPKAYLGKLIPMDQNGVNQAAISASQEQAVDGHATVSTGDEQATNSGTPAPADQGQAVDNGTPAPADQGQAVDNGTPAPADQGQAVD